MQSRESRELSAKSREILLWIALQFSVTCSVSSVAILFSRQYEFWLTEANLYQHILVLRFLVEEMQQILANEGELAVAAGGLITAVSAALANYGLDLHSQK